MRQIRECPLIKLDIELYDRATKTDTVRRGDSGDDMIIKSYQYLYESCRNLLDRERLKVNRERIAERGTKGKDGKGSAYAAAIGKGKGKKGNGKSQEPKGICYEFQATGKCSKGKNCGFKHEKGGNPKGGKKGKSRSGTPKGGRSTTPKRKMTREEMAKTPCAFFAKGNVHSW